MVLILSLIIILWFDFLRYVVLYQRFGHLFIFPLGNPEPFDMVSI